MTKTELLSSIIADLGDNYSSSDSTLLGTLIDEVVSDALLISGRASLPLEAQLDVLGSNIRKAVKSIYLQRGAEDVKTQALSGISSSYDNAIETMRHDIIFSQKRILQ